MITRQPHSSALRRVFFILCCTLAGSQLGGCAVDVDAPDQTEAARQQREALSADTAGVADTDDLDDPTADQTVNQRPDPLPWEPESGNVQSDPDPLPWQPDPLPWAPDPLPWQPTPTPGTHDTLRDGRENPSEMGMPSDQPSSDVTLKVEAAIEDR